MLTEFEVLGRKTGFLKAPPAVMATLDHVYSRLTPERQAGNRRAVLACYGCNKWRAEVEQKWLSPNAQSRERAVWMRANPGRVFLRDPLFHLPQV